MINTFAVCSDHLQEKFEFLEWVILLCSLFPLICYILLWITHMKVAGANSEAISGHHCIQNVRLLAKSLTFWQDFWQKV